METTSRVWRVWDFGLRESCGMHDERLYSLQLFHTLVSIEVQCNIVFLRQLRAQGASGYPES